MNIEIIKTPESDKSVLYNLLELYQHDFSEFVDIDLNKSGRFENERFAPNFLNLYWSDPNYQPFLVRVDGKLAGFVLINNITHISKNARSIAEFFIIKKYRRRGVGAEVAHQIFNTFPGPWEVAELETNLPAVNFWREVLKHHTGGNYTETIKQKGKWKIVIQTFNSNQLAPSKVS